MKILIATPLYPPDIGGPATYAKILNDELPKRGISVCVLSFGEVRHFPKGVSHVVYAWKIFRALRDADILLALDPVSTGLPVALVALLCGKKFIVRIAGDYAWEQGRQRFGVTAPLDEFVTMPSSKFLAQVRMLRAVQTFVASRAISIIVPSNYLKSIIVQWGIPAAKITVAYNACDEIPTLPPREVLRKRFGWNGPVLFSAGRLVPWKGFSLLIDLMPEILKRHPDCKLYIAGSGPLRDELKREIVNMKLERATILLGDVPKGALMEYISAADCFVLNTGYEGLSHQLLEALMLGTPIVTTRVGGNLELILHNETGLLVEYNDEVALLGAIEETLNQPERAQKMVQQGKQFAARFTVDRMVSETLAVLKSQVTSHKLQVAGNKS